MVICKNKLIELLIYDRKQTSETSLKNSNQDVYNYVKKDKKREIKLDAKKK